MVVIPKHNYLGAMIDFEGPDGCGKSTQVELTRDCWLPDPQVIFTKEPGKNRPWGAKIYRELSNKDPNSISKTNPFEFQTWYTEDSKQHNQELIIPHMKRGDTVITDRYRPSLVYGATSSNPDEARGQIEKLMRMNLDRLGEHFTWPDLVIIFDTHPDVCLERLKNRGGELDEFEKLETIIRIRRNYLLFAGMYPHCRVVNGDRPALEVFHDVQKLVNEVITNKYKKRQLG